MSDTDNAIAVIGMACRFPGADTPDDFWDLLREGREGITTFSDAQLAAAGVDAETRCRSDYVAAKGIVAEADGFDASFFGLSPADAALLDPQQRLFLECAWMAFEDAGYEPGAGSGAVGVFAGSILSTYLLHNVWPDAKLTRDVGAFQVALGNDPTFLATRTSWLLGLTGPSVSIGTACSTSLAAVHLACQSLIAQESDLALAGGSSVHLPLVGGYRYSAGGILSPDGHCRPFDAEAAGTVSSDGAGAVLLKRLEDAIADGDMIHAVIRGSAMNNDGREKVGFTAPAIGPQRRVIEEALAIAGTEPDTIALIEAHAAGTALGDPVEVAALADVFATGTRTAPCAIGSVKSNIGHIDAAAGIAGFIKAALAVRHRMIPPSLHYRAPNPAIDFRGAFAVPVESSRHDPSLGPMRAGISSFGIGGTNVHVVIEEPPRASERREATGSQLLLLSARSEPALDAATARLADRLATDRDVSLADAAHTLRVGRRAFAHRRFVVAGTREEAAAALCAPDAHPIVEAPLSPGAVVFMFPGLGDHYPSMGWELYCREPAFRAVVDECARLLRRYAPDDIRDTLYPDRDWTDPVADRRDPASKSSTLDLRAMLRPTPRVDPLGKPTAGQVAIFVTEYALARLLCAWGIEPTAMVGYSIGEFVCACLAEVVSLDDALAIVTARAALIEARVAPGAMLAVPLGEAAVHDLLVPGASIAAANTPRLTIVSGETEAIAAIERKLAARDISCRRLASAYAYHSRMLDPIVNDLAAIVARTPLSPPRIPYVSCVTGRWITDAESTDPRYSAGHLARTVRFADAVETLLQQPDHVLLEVGPGQSLSAHALAARERLGAAHPVIPAMRWAYGTQSETDVLLRAMGLLWQHGVLLDPERFLAREGQRRVPLPTYPFERERHWIDAPEAGRRAATHGRREIDDWFALPCWKPTPRPAPAQECEGTWLIFADAYGVGALLAERLRASGVRTVVVTMAESFARTRDGFAIDPAVEGDYRALIAALGEGNAIPEAIVHCWSLAPPNEGPLASDRFAAAQERGFLSIMRLLRAMMAHDPARTLRIEVVANGLFDVDGREPLAPERMTVMGPLLVAPQERIGTTCRCVDLDIDPRDSAQRERLVAQMLDEFSCAGGARAVAYRGGRRWQQGYEPLRLEAPEVERSPWRERGVYLLTGGLGGVGLALAEHLAKACRARLVLVGRSAFPARERWSDWLAEHDAADPVSIRIRRLQAIEALGAEVLTISADVADRDAMQAAIDLAERHFGEINGVFHGAGAIGVETFREIARTSDADAAVQLRAKAHGLIVLDTLLKGRALDFRVLMSSLSAVLGGLGFAAYGAANLFLDAFARASGRGDEPGWIAIDWDSWRLDDARPAVAGLGGTVADYYMTPDEAAAACERILTLRGISQVVVSTGDLDARRAQWTAPRLAEPRPAHARPALRTTYVAPRNTVEQVLADIWRDLFLIERIGIDDDFFALGGHSLLATQMTARIGARLHVDLPLTAVLRAPSIAALAELVASARLDSADPALLDRMIADLDGLDDATIGRLLAEETAHD